MMAIDPAAEQMTRTASDVLVAQLWEGDVAAFDALYDRYRRLVFGIALRISHDPRVAEDVSQVVFFKLWRSLGQYREGNLSAWISRVTRNQTIDALRQLRPARDALVRDVPDGELGLDEICDRSEADWVNAAVVRALGKLRTEQRAAIELGFFQGLTQAQIALETGAPLGTVKTRTRTGLRRLRVLLASEIALIR